MDISELCILAKFSCLERLQQVCYVHCYVLISATLSVTIFNLHGVVFSFLNVAGTNNNDLVACDLVNCLSQFLNWC